MPHVDFFHAPMTCVVPPPSESMPKLVWKEYEVVESGVHKWVGELIRLRHNPNWWLEGKHIIVLRNNFKGYIGRIVTTSLDATAVIELEANLRKERFNLKDLSI